MTDPPHSPDATLRPEPPRSPAGSPRSGGGRGPRLMLYSHDSWGLGHLRRNLNVAAALTRAQPQAEVLLVTGSPCATHFPVPERVDLVKIPSITKDADGHYRPRHWTAEPELALRLRGAILRESFQAFSPDVLLVDHQVVGAGGELLPILELALEQGVRTVLGVRDVIDSPAAVAREWGTSSARWALSTAYDRICVYGSPALFDLRSEYPIPPELGERLSYVGYLTGPAPQPKLRAVPSLRPRVLVTMGGGEDGAQRVERYLDALEAGPATWDTTCVLGPLMETGATRRLKARAAQHESVRMHRFYGDLPRLMSDTDLVVGMAGYNTAVEVLQARKPALFLPRTTPREEQLLRARCFEEHGLAKALVEPEPAELRAAILELLEAEPASHDLPLNGAEGLSALVGELVAEGRQPRRPQVIRSCS